MREDNQALDKTYEYEYNEIGNIVEIVNNGTTTTFGYSTEHPDRLISYNGSAITYDEYGNLKTSPGANGTVNYSWTDGKLTSITSGSLTTAFKNCTFAYDGYGRRISKNIASTSMSGGAINQSIVNTSYVYDYFGRLVRETVTNSYVVGVINTEIKTFLYDDQGLVGMIHEANGTTNTYYFHRNLQGDILGIYDTNGNSVAQYSYNAFGICTIVSGSNVTIANANPFRYRGYYYDTETGFYYLNARYYNPDWCRFISPDSAAYLNPDNPNGLNLYAYCGNDPVNYKDPSGHLAITTIAIITGVIIGFGISATSSIVTQLEKYNGDWSKVNPLEVLYDGAFGAINGGLAASGIGIVASAIFGGALGFVSSIGRDFLFEEDRNINWLGAVNSLFIGALAGLIAGAGANNVKEGMHVTKFVNSKTILNRTIANGTKRAIARQTHAMNVHAIQLLISSVKYMGSNAFSLIYTVCTN